MTNEKTTVKPTIFVRFEGPNISPDTVPLHQVSDALSAIQDLASGRDAFVESRVPPEKSIGLVEVKAGSAVYSCIARAPDEARRNLSYVGRLLVDVERLDAEESSLIASINPIKALSAVAKALHCKVEVSWADDCSPLFVVDESQFARISKKLFLTGETTVIGRVERVGGATGMRCLMRVPGRGRLLYCDVSSKELVQRLGKHLYETVAAVGTATWIHRTWWIYQFTIRDFSQPQIGDVNEMIQDLRNAGLDAWDRIDNPEEFIRELRG